MVSHNILVARLERDGPDMWTPELAGPLSWAR